MVSGNCLYVLYGFTSSSSWSDPSQWALYVHSGQADFSGILPTLQPTGDPRTPWAPRTEDTNRAWSQSSRLPLLIIQLADFADVNAGFHSKAGRLLVAAQSAVYHSWPEIWRLEGAQWVCRMIHQLVATGYLRTRVPEMHLERALLNTFVTLWKTASYDPVPRRALRQDVVEARRAPTAHGQ